jgi:hypothetical protein
MSSVVSQQKVGLYRIYQHPESSNMVKKGPDGNPISPLEIETDSDIFKFEDDGILSWESENEEQKQSGNHKKKKSNLKMNRMNFLNSLLNFHKQNRPRSIEAEFYPRNHKDISQIEIQGLYQKERNQKGSKKSIQTSQKSDRFRRIGSAAPKITPLFTEDHQKEKLIAGISSKKTSKQENIAEIKQPTISELQESATKIQRQWRSFQSREKLKQKQGSDAESSSVTILRMRQKIRVERNGEVVEKGKVFTLNVVFDKINLNLHFTAITNGSPLSYALKLQAFFDDCINPETNHLYPEKLGFCIEKAATIAKKFAHVLFVQDGLLTVENKNAIHNILDDIDNSDGLEKKTTPKTAFGQANLAAAGEDPKLDS